MTDMHAVKDQLAMTQESAKNMDPKSDGVQGLGGWAMIAPPRVMTP